MGKEKERGGGSYPLQTLPPILPTSIKSSFIRSKTHEIKRTPFNWTKQEEKKKRANFRGSPLFQATYKTKTVKQTINSTYLVSIGCERLAEGKGHETD